MKTTARLAVGPDDVLDTEEIRVMNGPRIQDHIYYFAAIRSSPTVMGLARTGVDRRMSSGVASGCGSSYDPQWWGDCACIVRPVDVVGSVFLRCVVLQGVLEMA